MEKVTGNKHRDSTFAMPPDVLSYIIKKIPHDTRNMLTSGAQFFKHSNNLGRSLRFVRVSLDFQEVLSAFSPSFPVFLLTQLILHSVLGCLE